MALRYPAVVSKVDRPGTMPPADCHRAARRTGLIRPVKGTLKGKIEDIEFSQEVELAASESKGRDIRSRHISQLNFESAAVVAGADGDTESVRAQICTFEVNGKVSDSRTRSLAFARSPRNG